MTNEFNQLGYLVVTIGHELPGDPPLSVSGNLFETRSENWVRGAKTIGFLKLKVSNRLERYDLEKLVLVGHSNGGDISSWFSHEHSSDIKSLITLDHRRVPLPRKNNIRILSIRASDFPADKGVLPSETDQGKNDSCIVKIANAKHNEMTDFGPEWLKEKIRVLVRNYLSGHSCSVIIN